jgi:hypothetical protein
MNDQPARAPSPFADVAPRLSASTDDVLFGAV